MDKRDKQLFRTYIDSVGRVAYSLRDSERENRHDRELAGYFRRLAEDLEHVTSDIADTLERIE